MATIAKSMVDTIDGNWNVGLGGVKPTIRQLMSDKGELASTTEQVIVRVPWQEDAVPINDTYSNIKYTLTIRIKTTTDEDRLKEIKDEVIRIILTNAITGIDRQFVGPGENKSDKSRAIFIHELRAICEDHVSTGGSSYSGTTMGDVTVSGDLTVTGKTDVTGRLTAEFVYSSHANPAFIGSGTTGLVNLFAGGPTVGAYVSCYGATHATKPGRLEYVSNSGGAATGKHIWRNYGGAGWTDIAELDGPTGNFQHDGTHTFGTAQTAIDDVLDEDAMGSDSATALATQQSIKAYVDAALMIGSANAAFVPCVFELEGGATNVGNVYFDSATAGIANVAAATQYVYFRCPLPTVKGSLKLYVDDVRIGLADASATDYVTALYVIGNNYNTGGTTINSDGTDRTAPNTYTYAFAAADASGYDSVHVYPLCVIGAGGGLDITSVELLCYYTA